MITAKRKVRPALAPARAARIRTRIVTRERKKVHTHCSVVMSATSQVLFSKNDRLAEDIVKARDLHVQFMSLDQFLELFLAVGTGGDDELRSRRPESDPLS